MNDLALLVQIQSPRGEWVDVGLLHSREQHNWFEFLDSYWELGHRPVLGQIFEEQGRKWKSNAHVSLPRWFSHLLPEGRLREAVARAADVNAKREFELIARLGSTDLPGATRVIASELGNEHHGPPPQGVDDSDSDVDPVLKFSLAGAQLKFSIFADDRGLTVPAHGQAGNWILKFPDGRAGFDGVPEAELATMELARASGIETPRVNLVDAASVQGLGEWAATAKGNAIAIERFDRIGVDGRRHMEELAQVLDIPTGRGGVKYSRANFETIAVFVAALAGVDRVADVIDRIVLNVLVGNGDAHLKNWAFTYPDGRTPALSPVYDVLPTVLYIENDDLGLNLRGTKEFALIEAKSFDWLGSRSGYGERAARDRARAAAERILAEWDILATYLSKAQFERLSRRLRTLPLAR